MSELDLTLYASDYEGNEQIYDISIDLATWKVKEYGDRVKYAPYVSVRSVTISVDHDELVKMLMKDSKEEKYSIFTSHYDFK